ncbi:MAG: proline dehydrogenase family protein [Geothrix sp.]|uniref:proline dehydrogenase family protein n=1 Tax=Geothrix sp. TaxID=1962974 RepID=UPI0017E4E98A|nr:proline dehydrogenase family protein [Geothrix sp.]NWJ42562.1 proline dehydrogenase family protein [Geothrix sp.]WIL19478.1 MAG: proline dehydrogenase family protein [Geothrix sp.]
MIRKAAQILARQAWFRKLVMSTPIVRELAGRFVGGEDLASALAAARGANARGLKTTLNFHGMHVLDLAEAEGAAQQAMDALVRIREEGLDSNVSIKLTKIGLDLDPAYCQLQLRRILECAAGTGGFVRIDMEESNYVETTLRVFEEMQDRFGNGTVGLVIQSYLRHRAGDLDRLLDRKASIRLVKGGYREPASQVFRSKAEVDAAFNRDIERLLLRGVSPAIATHDEAAIAWTLAVQARLGLGREAFEFQMLYGVRPDLQERLLADGCTVRCYIPYGGDWATHAVGCLRRIPAGALTRFRHSLHLS